MVGPPRPPGEEDAYDNNAGWLPFALISRRLGMG
jgi:hypothetical protein